METPSFHTVLGTTGWSRPEMHDRVSTSRGNVSAVGRPGHAQGPIGIVCARCHWIAADKVPGHGVPHLYCFFRSLISGIAAR
jgi:hypothetical protein